MSRKTVKITSNQMNKLVASIWVVFISFILISELSAENIIVPGDPTGIPHQMALVSSTRHRICLNGEWDFYPIRNDNNPTDFQTTLETFNKRRAETPPVPPEAVWEKILVPSSWAGYWGSTFLRGDGKDYSSAWGGNIYRAWYRRFFAIPEEWQGGRIKLYFSAAAGVTRVFLNGKLVTDHFDSHFPFECDVTDIVKHDGQNELRVFRYRN